MTYCYKRMLKFYDNVERKVGIRRMNWDKFVEDFRGYISRYVEENQCELQHGRKSRIENDKNPTSLDSTTYNYLNCDSLFVKPMDIKLDSKIRIDKITNGKNEVIQNDFIVESACAEFRQLPNGEVVVIIFPAKCELYKTKAEPLVYTMLRMNKKVKEKIVRSVIDFTHLYNIETSPLYTGGYLAATYHIRKIIYLTPLNTIVRNIFGKIPHFKLITDVISDAIGKQDISTNYSKFLTKNDLET